MQQTNAVSGSYTILPENAPKGLRIVNEMVKRKVCYQLTKNSKY